MEGKIKTKPINGTKTIQENKELKYYHNKEPKNRIFFNAVTGQEINLDCENEEDMYELSRDIENYNEDKINNCSDLNDKDKLFFQTWNNFMKNKSISDNFSEILIEFLNKNFKIIFENDLKKNFLFHLMIIYEHRQLNEKEIINIIDFVNNLYNQYQQKK